MTTAKLIRGGVRLVILALVVGLVSAAARESVAGLPVTIDGEQVLVRRGADVCDALGGMTEMPEGRILAASDSRVLAESSGMSGTVLLNGKAAPLSAVLHEGDCIETVLPTDIVEPVVQETRTIEVAPRVIGAGSVEKVVSAGSTGFAIVRVGSVSGDVVATETVVPATPAVVRMVPAPGTNLVALTFDDDPWPGQTERVLAILEQRNVPATFFMLGMRVERAPDLAAAVANSGHLIGNHTYWHVNLSTVQPDVARWEIEGTNQMIQTTTGMRPSWLRAPGGQLGGAAQAYIAQAGMRHALWTVDPQDWRAGTPSEEIAWRVISAVNPGAVVVLHDGGGDRNATIAALPIIIDELRARGYEFVTLDELPEVRSGW